MSANPHRGEAEIKVGDKTYVLRPSFENLAAIEAATGARLLPLARRFGALDFGVVDIVAVLNAAATEKPPQDIGDRVIRAGAALIGVAVGNFLAAALNGGQSGNGEAPETTAPTTS